MAARNSGGDGLEHLGSANHASNLGRSQWYFQVRWLPITASYLWSKVCQVPDRMCMYVLSKSSRKDDAPGVESKERRSRYLVSGSGSLLAGAFRAAKRHTTRTSCSWLTLLNSREKCVTCRLHLGKLILLY